MCPFCISAVAVVAAKAVAATGGGAVLVKAALNKARRGNDSSRGAGQKCSNRKRRHPVSPDLESAKRFAFRQSSAQ